MPTVFFIDYETHPTESLQACTRVKLEVWYMFDFGVAYVPMSAGKPGDINQNLTCYCPNETKYFPSKKISGAKKHILEIYQGAD